MNNCVSALKSRPNGAFKFRRSGNVSFLPDEKSEKQEPEPLFFSPSPNPALKGTRGYALAGFPPVPPARAP